MRVKNKVAMITGAASGQGRAAALLFAAEGGEIALIDLNDKKLQELTLEIESTGGKASSFPCDIRDEGAVKGTVDSVLKRYGRIDILLNCAGKIGPAGKDLMDELTLEEWNSTLGVNLIGPWLCIKYAVEPMKRQGSGVIVNVSSTAAVRAIPGASPYCVSKAAQSMLTKTAALEYIPWGIRVNEVLPGHIDTPMMDSVIKNMEAAGVSDARNKVHTQSNPMGRLGTAEEVASILLFLASDESSFMTGTGIYADGGFTAG